MNTGSDDWWSHNLLPSKLDGVEFPIAERKVSTGRRFARYVYPYRNGQGVEDLGRKIYTFHLTIPLFRGVAVALYPGTYDKLLAINDDETKKGEVEYVDPEFGPINVKVVDFDWETVPQRRDGGILTLVLEERSFDQSLTSNLGKPQFAARTLARQRAKEIDFAMDGLDTSIEEVSPGAGFPSLTELWSKFQGVLDEAAMAADVIAAQIDEVTMIGQDVLNFSAEDEIERWSIVNSVTDFLGAVQDVGDTSSNKPAGETLISVTLPTDMSMFDIAQWRYKDPYRAQEIAFNNNVPNPMNYPRGTKVRVFAA